MMVSQALAHFQCRIDSAVMEFCPPCSLLFSDGGAEEGEDEQKRQLASRSETCV